MIQSSIRLTIQDKFIVILVIFCLLVACSVAPTRPASSPSKTIAPLQTPTATSMPACSVTVGHVFVREKPTRHSRAVRVANKDEQLVILGRTENDWLKIKDGYVYSVFCR